MMALNDNYKRLAGDVLEYVHTIVDTAVRNTNLFEHKTVIKNGMFRLYKQIRADLYDPLLNIYRIEG